MSAYSFLASFTVWSHLAYRKSAKPPNKESITITVSITIRTYACVDVGYMHNILTQKTIFILFHHRLNSKGETQAPLSQTIWVVCRSTNVNMAKLMQQKCLSGTKFVGFRNF